MKETITNRQASVLPNRVQMGHEWGIMLHSAYLSYSHAGSRFRHFLLKQMPHHLFMSKWGISLFQAFFI